MNWKWFKNNDPERKKKKMLRTIYKKKCQLIRINKPGRLKHLQTQITRLEAYVQWM